MMTGHIKSGRVWRALWVMLFLTMCLASFTFAQIRRRYHGIDLDLPKRRCTMELRGADVSDVLRIFGDQYNLNLVLGSDVKGTVDLKLNQVPVDDAFLTILRSAKLAYIREGDIYRIMSLEKMAEENELRTKSLQLETRIFRPQHASAKRLATSMKNIISKREDAFIDADERTNAIVVKDIPEKLDEMDQLFRMLDVEQVTAVRPVKVEIIELKFIDPEEMGKNIQSLLSESGKVEVNRQANSLIISDFPENLSQMKSLIDSLDQPSRQVLIEAKVVETTKNFSRELGIQWGGSYTDGPPKGKAFPRTTITGTVSPEFTGDTAYGIVGLSMGHLRDKVLLDIQLAAMEEKGEGRILSSPKIATLDNTMALIKIGKDVPFTTRETDYRQQELQGITIGILDVEKTVEFREALTKLEVTPHITADNRIKMKIIANKDDVDFSKTVDGNPLISRKEAQTELIVKDGETTVIGGFSISESRESRKGVPWFADLPVIGALFRNKYKLKNYDELLIFITPRILEN